VFLCLTLLVAGTPGGNAALDSEDASAPIRLRTTGKSNSVAGATPAPVTASGDDQLEAEGSAFRYVLGRGDQITVTDYGGIDLRHGSNTQTVTILPDGTASIYPIGVVLAAGKTLSEMNTIVNERAKKYMIEPKLLVSLARPRPVTVYVLGDVLNPGIYTLGAGGTQTSPPPNQSPSADIGEALGRNSLSSISLPEPNNAGGAQAPLPETTTLLSALQKAGGLKDSANVRSIRITRARTKEIILADLWKLLVTGDVSQDIELEPRDVVFVRRGGTGFDPDELGRLAATKVCSVRIWGAVKIPGLYNLGPNDDVLSAIAKAGGFTPTAFKGSVLLSRVSRDGTVIKKRISIAKSLRDEGLGRTPVRPGDVIIASTNPLASAAKPLTITALTIGAAMILIYFASRIPNINVNNNQSSNNTNVRVAVPIL